MIEGATLNGERLQMPVLNNLLLEDSKLAPQEDKTETRKAN